MARLRRLPLALVAVLAVVAGCGGTTEAGSGGADVVPASAVAYLSVNTDFGSSQWKTLANLAKKFPDEQHALDTVKQAAGKQGVDFEHDLQPALGPELDLAWLDLENDGQNFVFLVQPDDTSKFEELLKKNGAQSGVVSEQVGGWQVVAKSREVIARFKRESEAGPVLADDATFKDAMDSYPDDSLFRVFVDGKPVMDAIHKLASGGDLDKLGSLDWIAANIRVTDEGIRFDTNVHGTAGPALKNVATGKSFTSSLARKVPSDALLFATFHGAKGMFRALENSPVFGQTPELKEYAGLLRQVETLLQGENAIYIRPGSGKIPEITLVTEPAAGTNGMVTLDRILAQNRDELPAQPKHTRIAGAPARTIPLGPVGIHYAKVGKNLVITDSPAAIEALKGNVPSLDLSDEYKGALKASGMPARTQGFFYVSFKGGLGYAERLSETPIPDAIKRNLRPLRSAVEYALSRPSEVQLTLFIRVG
jgi:Protein of unknown function (DUF3352)